MKNILLSMGLGLSLFSTSVLADNMDCVGFFDPGLKGFWNSVDMSIEGNDVTILKNDRALAHGSIRITPGSPDGIVSLTYSHDLSKESFFATASREAEDSRGTYSIVGFFNRSKKQVGGFRCYYQN